MTGLATSKRSRTHLEPSLSLICRLVVGALASTSNTPALLCAAGAGAATAGDGAADSLGSVSDPRRCPDPPNGPDGALGWRDHFSPVRFAIRSSTGWS